MKAIRTVTCFIGKKFPPRLPTLKGKKKNGIKTRTSGPSSISPRAQQTATQLVSKDIHSRTPPSPLRPPTACPPLPHPRVLMLFSFSGSSLVGSHSPQKLSSITYSPEGVCVGAGPPASLWLSAQSLSSALGDSSSRMTSGCAPLRGRALRRAARSLPSEDLLTRSVIPRETPDSEVWC